ncbi:hypothetical protein BJ944DRAFT_244189 [Cunninghamella echinulata]|nr:hypothetical protein BJ944DRAFT_244189 [Cunninghamella echinulata]
MRTKHHLTNEFDWDESHYQYGGTTTLTTTTKSPSQQQTTINTATKKPYYKTIFSDDEDDPIPPPMTTTTLPKWMSPSAVSLTPSTTATYVDPLLSSGAYLVHQAENALSTLKHIVMEDGWKKALKHKSGVVVHMKSGLHKNDKTPIFKGEAIIQGFSPQSIFYVIGMRKLWDEQYEDGNLVENLNEATSLTYEVTKPTATSKSRDFSLVERIECTQNGSIIFVATSVETPRIPRIHGRTRAQIKLQGWILEPIRGNVPSTKVTFVIQENMKGWVPGFAKKSLARRPLVIALINDYLQKKSDRMRSQQKSSLLSPFSHGHHQQQQRPSIHGQLLNPTSLPSKDLSQRNSPTPSPTPSQRSILLGSNISNTSGKKRITFAEQNTTYPSSNTHYEETYHHNRQQQQQQQQQQEGNREIMLPISNQNTYPITTTTTTTVAAANNNINISNNQQYINSNHELPLLTPNSPLTALSNSLIASSKQQQQQQSIKQSSSSQRLYSVNRHSSKKIECLKLIKQLSNSPVGWSFTEEKNGIRYYSHQHYSFLRSEGIIYGGWTPEQLCSVIHCIGARKMWDKQFEHGQVLERFSQKDYLVKWTLKDRQSLTVISTIDTDTSIGAIYTASTSVVDDIHKIEALPLSSQIQLYGWIFVPIKDTQGHYQGVQASMIMDQDMNHHKTNSDIMNGLIQYLSQHGCPPYIRRVAGKIIHESFSLEKGYEMSYIVKHEPSSNYKARKSNPEKNWCTDLRIDPSKQFALGFDLRITPSHGIRVELSETIIKIFTTTADLEGKQISLHLAPSSLGKVTYNGTTMFYIKDTSNNNNNNNNNAKKNDDLDNVHIEKTTQNNKVQPSFPSTPTPSQGDHLIKDETLTASPSSSSSPSKTSYIHQHPKDQQEEEQEKEQNQEQQRPISSSSHISFNHLQIPDGYMIVPQSHNNINNNNILILSEDLTFNGQQLAIMFLAMVISYYMGKFACQC